MKIAPALKTYLPVAALMAIGATCILYGVAEGDASGKNTSIPTFRNERERLAAQIVPTLCALEGKVTINYSPFLVKGVLLIHPESNLQDAATFCDITADGNYLARNVPEGRVIIVIRPDLETTIRAGMPKKRTLESMAKHRDSRESKSWSWGFLQDMKLDSRETDAFALIGAYAKYSNPESPDAVRTTVVAGVNHFDVDFQVPSTNQPPKTRRIP